MKTDTPRPIRLKNYRPSEFLIDTVNLDFSLHPTATQVKAVLVIRRNPARKDYKGGLRLDGENLKLLGVKLNGEALSRDKYKVSSSELVIDKVPAKTFQLEIETEINPEANKALQGLYLSRGIYCTQCEAEGFRCITYFLDRPDVLAKYTTRIEADQHEASVLLSNGNPVERGTTGDRHHAIWHDPHPKPSYLFALVGGNLTSIASEFETASGDRVDLRIYVEPGKEERCWWAMDSLKRSMKWDEERFGREYDLEVFNIVAVSDFNMGAMENKGLNIFNDRLILASPDTATDQVYAAIEAVVAHEYFHNWTGNRITCRDWFQLCLKEGLTVFRDQEFTGDERDHTVARINDVRELRAHQFPEDGGPLAHPVRPQSYIEINNFYTATVYEKGAELVRMIQTICGRDGFKKGMNLYFKRHDGDAATIEDFIACFEKAAKVDLSQFQTWYHQAGTPELVCGLQYNAKNNTAELTIEQVLPPTPGDAKKKALHIPFRVGLLDKSGRDMALKLADGSTISDGILHVTKRSQKFQFVNVDEPPTPSLLRGFSAPVNLSANLSDRDLEFLMAHDSDLFARWQATSDYATRIMVQLARSEKHDKHLARVERYASALGASLQQEGLKPAYIATLLALPSEADIAREIKRNVDPAAIHIAHKQFAKRLGEVLGNLLEDFYGGNDQSKTPFSPDAAAAGRRALRNIALTRLNGRDGDDDKNRLASHFKRANNMTDQAHALFLLAARGGKPAETALASFKRKWRRDHIVIDTWFAAQAAAPARGTISNIRQLMKDPLYSATTPNKIRALVGTFAMFNPSQFNRVDGAGYRFVAQQVLKIDKFNPQVAARLLNVFRIWRTLEPRRRREALGALKGIAQKQGLSRDVYEIVSKIVE